MESQDRRLSQQVKSQIPLVDLKQQLGRKGAEQDIGLATDSFLAPLDRFQSRSLQIFQANEYIGISQKHTHFAACYFIDR